MGNYAGRIYTCKYNSSSRCAPSRGSLGSHFPTFPGTIRRYDCHRPFSGAFACRLFPDTLRASLVRGVPGGLVARRKLPVTPGLLVTRSPTPGLSSRRPMALPSSRVPPVKPCPALRPRWCPAHSPQRTQDCCLPASGSRRRFPLYDREDYPVVHDDTHFGARSHGLRPRYTRLRTPPCGDARGFATDLLARLSSGGT